MRERDIVEFRRVYLQIARSFEHRSADIAQVILASIGSEMKGLMVEQERVSPHGPIANFLRAADHGRPSRCVALSIAWAVLRTVNRHPETSEDMDSILVTQETVDDGGQTPLVFNVGEGYEVKGQPARIICTDALGTHPIVALVQVEGVERVHTFDMFGMPALLPVGRLVPALVEHSAWLVLFRDGTASTPFDSEEKARERLLESGTGTGPEAYGRIHKVTWRATP